MTACSLVNPTCCHALVKGHRHPSCTCIRNVTPNKWNDGFSTCKISKLIDLLQNKGRGPEDDMILTGMLLCSAINSRYIEDAAVYFEKRTHECDYEICYCMLGKRGVKKLSLPDTPDVRLCHQRMAICRQSIPR